MGERSAAEDNTLVKQAAVSNFSGFSDDNAHAVVYDHSPPNDGAGMYLYTGQKASYV